MKRLLTILAVFISAVAQAQNETPWNYNAVNNAYDGLWPRGYFLLTRDTTRKNIMDENYNPVGDSGQLGYWHNRPWWRDNLGIWRAFNEASLPGDTIHNWSFQGPVISYSQTKSDDSHTFNLGGDTLINLFRYDPAQTHVSNSDSVMKRFSYDGGLSWTSPSKVYATDSVDGNQSSGLLDNGVLVAFLRRYDVASPATTSSVGFIRSTDKGATWSSFTLITPIASEIVVPFGKIYRKSNGNYIVLLYARAYCEAWESSDNGASWTSAGVVYDYRVTNPERALMEPMVANVGGGKLILHARDELLGGPFYQLISSDDGTTWNWQGRTNIGGDSTAKVAPCIEYDASKDVLISVLTQRHVDNTANSFTYNTKNDSVVVYINRPDEVFSTPTAYRQQMSFRRPDPDLLSMYGYADLVRLQSGSYLGLFIDRVGVFPGEKSRLWQFDIKYLVNKLEDVSSRYSGLTPRYNAATGFNDMLNSANQGEVVSRSDSMAVMRPGGTLMLTAPGWGGNIAIMRAKTGALFHTFQATGRTLWNGAVDDLTNAMQVSGGIRLTGQLRMQGGSPAANRIMRSDATGVGSWVDGNTMFLGLSPAAPQTGNSSLTGSYTGASFQSRDSATDVFQLRNAGGDLRWTIGSAGSGYDLRISQFDNSGNRATIARFNRMTGQAAFGYGVSPSVVPLSVVSPGQTDQGAEDVMFQAVTNNPYATGRGATIAIGGMYRADTSGWFGAIKGYKGNNVAGSYAGGLSFWTRQTGQTLSERMRIDTMGRVGIGITTPLYFLDVTGTAGQIAGRFGGRLIVDNAINSNEALAKGQYDAGIATAVKNNANNQSVISPFNINGTGAGAASFSLIRGFEADGTTARWSLGDASSGDTHTYLISTTDLKFMAGGSVRLNMLSGGNIAVGSHTPTALLDVSASTGYNQLRLRTTYTPTGTSDANGSTGDVSWDDNYIYIKTSAGWKRAALSTF